MIETSNLINEMNTIMKNMCILVVWDSLPFVKGPVIEWRGKV